MGYEVELKYRLADHGELERRLIELGAERGPEISQEDIYLSHPSRDFAAMPRSFLFFRFLFVPPISIPASRVPRFEIPPPPVRYLIARPQRCPTF